MCVWWACVSQCCGNCGVCGSVSKLRVCAWGKPQCSPHCHSYTWLPPYFYHRPPDYSDRDTHLCMLQSYLYIHSQHMWLYNCTNAPSQSLLKQDRGAIWSSSGSACTTVNKVSINNEGSSRNITPHSAAEDTVRQRSVTAALTVVHVNKYADDSISFCVFLSLFLSHRWNSSWSSAEY